MAEDCCRASPVSFGFSMEGDGDSCWLPTARNGSPSATRRVLPSLLLARRLEKWAMTRAHTGVGGVEMRTVIGQTHSLCDMWVNRFGQAKTTENLSLRADSLTTFANPALRRMLHQQNSAATTEMRWPHTSVSWRVPGYLCASNRVSHCVRLW